MTQFRVDFSTDAEDDLDAIRQYIASEATRDVAERFTSGLIARCEKLAVFPERGAPRDDLLPGLRTIVHKRTVLIAYRSREEAVTVLGFFYRGRDIDAVFREIGTD